MNIQKGFATVRYLIIAFALAALGVGTWFAYPYFSSLLFDANAKIIPADLREFAIGENADALVIININDEVAKLINETPEAESIKELTGVVMASRLADESGYVAMSFKSESAATAIKQQMDEQRSKVTQAADAAEIDSDKAIIEQKGRVIIVSYSKNSSTLTGELAKNSLLKSLVDEDLNSQLIARIDLTNIIDKDLNKQVALITTPLSLLKIANAQGTGFISANDGPTRIAGATETSSSDINPTMASLAMMKDVTILGSLKEKSFSLKLKVSVKDKADFAAHAAVQKMAKIGNDTAENLYETGINSINEAITMANMFKGSITKEAKFIQRLDLTFEQPDIILDFAAEINDETREGLKDMISAQMDAPASARDAANKANLNSIMMVIEQHRAIDGALPKTSTCVDEQFELRSYLLKIPESVYSDQQFGDIDCQNHYYYQNLGEDGYAIWAKLNDDTKGNTDLTPSELSAKVLANEEKITQEGGKYYIFIEYPSNIGKGAPTTPSTTQKPKVKAKR